MGDYPMIPPTVGYRRPASPKCTSSPPQISPERLLVRRCDYCEEEHPASSYCPKKPCTVCFTPQHNPVYCPYIMQHIPRGAKYDRLNYHVICGGGGGCDGGDLYFDEEKWLCFRCRGQGTTRLRLKHCAICYESSHHCTGECPKDKFAAAEYRAKRDFYRSQPIYRYPADLDSARRAATENPNNIASLVEGNRL